MKKAFMDCGSSNSNSFWILGSGKFGQRAVHRLMSKYPDASLLVVDNDVNALKSIENLAVQVVRADGVAFLAEKLGREEFPSFIVPAVPIHLLFEWLAEKLRDVFDIARIAVPEQMDSLVPNPMRAENGKLYSSYANFYCPDNCPEPPDTCTVTGEKRRGLLYRDLADIQIDGFVNITIRSCQLAPGVGGYSPGVLLSAYEEVLRIGARGKYLLSTACLCHGVTDVFNLREKA